MSIMQHQIDEKADNEMEIWILEGLIRFGASKKSGVPRFGVRIIVIIRFIMHLSLDWGPPENVVGQGGGGSSG